MERRRFLGGTAALATALSGCAGLIRTRSASREPPVVEDRPDAIYYPTHAEGMATIGTATAGDLAVALTYSYPHRFWTVTGRDTRRVGVDADDSVHLMVSAWDPETETVLPVASPSVTVEGNGLSGSPTSPWPMLSQNMGFHYGDNFALEGDGTYRVAVDANGVGVRRLGAFDGRFGEGGTAEFEFEYRQAERDDLDFRRLDDSAGERGALDPMKMEMVPTSVAPAPDALPGTVGTTRSGDVDFAVAVLDDAPAADGGPYLAVSPRTRYNAVPLPMMGVSARLERGGEAVFEGDLREAVGPDLGIHYGAAVDGVEAGDELTVTVGTPPQVSRHEGYETAFADVPPATVTL